MKKNAKVVVIAVLVAALAAGGLWVARDLYLGGGSEIQCDDGVRRTIDLRAFTTQYWAYAVEFEATLQDTGSLKSRLDPRQLQELNAAQQQAFEFRKFVVAGFNSCALSKAQFARYGTGFQALDMLAREIKTLGSKASLNDAEKVRLEELVGRYGTLVEQLTTENT